MVDATKNSLLKIRWQAEAALSGFSDMSEEESLSSARYSLQCIVEILDEIDRANGIFGDLQGRARHEATVLNFNLCNPIDPIPLRTPTDSLSTIFSDDYGLQSDPIRDFVKEVGFDEGNTSSGRDHNILSILDSVTNRILDGRRS